MEEITKLLRRAAAGDRDAIDRVVPLVYQELYQLAEKQMQRERPNHTLQPTALVNEAYMRLVGEKPASYQDRNHFYAIASKKMREILINHANHGTAQRRGGGWKRQTMDPSIIAPGKFLEPIDSAALEEALKRLEARSDVRCKRMARIVEMSLFSGMREGEIAQSLKLSKKTIERELKVAKMILLKELSDGNGP